MGLCLSSTVEGAAAKPTRVRRHQKLSKFLLEPHTNIRALLIDYGIKQLCCPIYPIMGEHLGDNYSSDCEKYSSTEQILSLPQHCSRKSIRSPQTNLFLGCAPLTGIQRSLSTPRTVRLQRAKVRRPLTIPNPREKNNSKLSKPMLADDLLSLNLSETPICSDCALHIDHTSSHVDNSPCETRTSSRSQPMEEKCKHVKDEQNSPVSILPDSSLFPSILPASPFPCSPGFRDPLLEELDMDLPVPPPPPPRAMPSWLRLALQNQRESSSSSGRIVLPNSPDQDRTAPFAPWRAKETALKRQKSCSLEHNRFNVRIYPVLQNGVKISDTHYWLIDPPRSLSTHYTPSLGRHRSERAPPPSPASNESSSNYLNMSPTVNLRRGVSELNKEAFNSMHREMVARLYNEVPAATEGECQAVLIGSGYKFDEASKRLKLELLCRCNYVSRSRCKRLLVKCNWDLDAATECARQERETRLRYAPSHALRAAGSDLPANFSAPSSTSPISCPYMYGLQVPRSPCSSESSYTHEPNTDLDSLPSSPNPLSGAAADMMTRH
ncbi:hypothetical protein EG68_08248 [Paragonimus skrjabini miyazakii]|uniref:Uncharacterized protein n=1 Tax=Paragonimus skrjabini miyazakii TaxID=59628 RepID=A0A8S9YVF7_9TREM|nr:hypothetical protein EG68_08248 [Paragonimus skrjabini miyazakii]